MTTGKFKYTVPVLYTTQLSAHSATCTIDDVPDTVTLWSGWVVPKPDERPKWAHRFGADKYGYWAAHDLTCAKTGKLVEIVFRYAPPGEFMMGATAQDSEQWQKDRPRTRQAIPKGFWIMATKCTQAQYQAVMGTNPAHFSDPKRYPEHLQHPVESVNWYDSDKFMKKLAELFGLHPDMGRLPYEQEWEYVTRAGTSDRTPNPGAELGDIAWYGENSNSQTHPVAQKLPNALGLYDTIGLCYEWTCTPAQDYPLPQLTAESYYSGRAAAVAPVQFPAEE